VSSTLGEPLWATASQVRSWVLLEQPGPWGPQALLESRLDPAVARALHARAHRLGVRVVLIRRPGRSAPGPHNCYLAHTGTADRWVEHGWLDDPAALLDVDLAALARGERPGFGELVGEPLHLVCTNGRHDRCCAIFGRPLVSVLHAALGPQVWECAHIGGDRFAANLVCFPDGLYFGRVDPDDGLRVAEKYASGRIDLLHYRGCCAYDWETQAAEQFVRARAGLDGVGDLLVERTVRSAGGAVVELSRPGHQRWVVQVKTAPSAEGRRLTCTAARVSFPPTYSLSVVEEV
jgi:hypothetical protein